MRIEAPAHRDVSARLQTAHAIVEQSFAMLAFPLQKEAAIAQVGDRALPADLRLGDILRGLPDQVFRDPYRAARATDDRMLSILRALSAVEDAERDE